MRTITRAMLAFVLALAAGVAVAETGNETGNETGFADAWGPAIGSVTPGIEAPDQSGTPRSLDDLAGANGLLVLFNRSADW